MKTQEYAKRREKRVKALHDMVRIMLGVDLPPESPEWHPTLRSEHTIDKLSRHLETAHVEQIEQLKSSRRLRCPLREYVYAHLYRIHEGLHGTGSGFCSNVGG